MLTSSLKWLLLKATPSSSDRTFATSITRLADEGKRLSGETHRVNNFEKKLLVWMGKYKTVDEIPAYVTPESVERARSKMRIRVANIMMALTLVGCGVMIYSGKHARERGESVHQYNLDMHKKFNEQEKEKEKI